MTQMVPGEIIVHKDGRDLFLATGEGLIEITANRVSILTDLAVQPTVLTKPKPKKRGCVRRPGYEKNSRTRKSRPSMPPWPALLRNYTSSAANAGDRLGGSPHSASVRAYQDRRISCSYPLSAARRVGNERYSDLRRRRSAHCLHSVSRPAAIKSTPRACSVSITSTVA